jgi:hypothetical protein
MKQYVIFIFLIIFYNDIILCQSDWCKGYLVTNNNDTISGEVNYLGNKSMSEECKFRESPKSAVSIYYPKDIDGYEITKYAKFVSHKIDGEKLVFLECLVDGNLDLFYIRMNDKDRFFIQNDSLPLKEIKYEEEIRSREGIKYLYKSTAHIGLISLYTKDAPELYNRILHLKNDFISLRNFTIDYHNLVCKDKSCISYRNKDTYTKISIGPQFGYTKQSYYGDNTEVVENYIIYGIFVRVWSPRINKNLSIRTGALISKFDDYNYNLTKKMERKTIVKIPLQFEYVLPLSLRIRPRASVGFIYFTNSDTYFVAGLGADVAINKNVTFSIGYEKGIQSLFGFGFSENKNNTIIAGGYFQL